MTLRAGHALADNASPVLEGAVDGLRAAGLDIRVDPDAATTDCDLLLACGLLTIELIERTGSRRIVAAPRFPGEAAPTYRSVVIARSPVAVEDVGGAALAINEYGSWSGWHGFAAWLAGRGIHPTGPHVLTGSHHASVDAVRRGDAEVAAIDATVWRDLVDRTGLEVIATTGDWPAPPFSVAGTLPARVAGEIAEALFAVDGIEPAADDDYRFMLENRRSLS